MKTWKQFLEITAEEKEEKTGMDLDQDGESGESASHRAKVKKAKAAMLSFFEKRKSGALEIAKKAKEKGGAAELTYWHFLAKDKPYASVLEAIREDKSESWFLGKCRESLSSIHCGKMSQKDFQQKMGELEVWGEAASQLFQSS